MTGIVIEKRDPEGPRLFSFSRPRKEGPKGQTAAADCLPSGLRSRDAGMNGLSEAAQSRAGPSCSAAGGAKRWMRDERTDSHAGACTGSE